MGETGRKLGGRFREHLRVVGRNDNDAPKPLAHQFKFASHSSPGTREADFENTLVCREMKKDVYTKFNGGFLGVGGGGGGKGVYYGRIWKGENGNRPLWEGQSYGTKTPCWDARNVLG